MGFFMDLTIQQFTVYLLYISVFAAASLEGGVIGGIGIIGTGISGMHLALYLQSRGIDTTIYSPKSIEEHRADRLPNCVVRWYKTLEREGELGIAHWPENDIHALSVAVVGDPPLDFTGRLSGPGNTTDFRIYVPRLMEDYAERGGEIVVRPIGPEDLDRLAMAHELIVVAAGRDGFGGVFPRDESRSPNDKPRRYLVAVFTTVSGRRIRRASSSRSIRARARSSNCDSIPSTGRSVPSPFAGSRAVRWRRCRTRRIRTTPKRSNRSCSTRSAISRRRSGSASALPSSG